MYIYAFIRDPSTGQGGKETKTFPNPQFTLLSSASLSVSLLLPLFIPSLPPDFHSHAVFLSLSRKKQGDGSNQVSNVRAGD